MTITRVHENHNIKSYDVVSYAENTLSFQPIQGNTVIAAISTFNNSGKNSSIKKIVQEGVSWHWSASMQSDNKYWNVEIWSGNVWRSTPAPSATFKIYINEGPCQEMIAEIREYSGISSHHDINFSYSGNSRISGYTYTGMTPQTTTQTNELWVAAIFQHNYSQTGPAANDFTLLDGTLESSYSNSLAYLDKIVSATGQVFTGTQVAGDDVWFSCMACFTVDKMAPNSPNCATGNAYGNKGITIWETNQNHHLAPGDYRNFIFTGTHPEGYSGKSSCNVIWSIALDNSSSDVNDVKIFGWLNSVIPLTTYHSKIKGHDCGLFTELAAYSENGAYNDDGVNMVTFTNPSTNDTGVTIQGFRVLRTYEMCDLDITECFGDHPLQDRPGSTAYGSIDGQRQDYSCQYGFCTPRYSLTKFGGPGSSQCDDGTIPAGQSRSWTWTNPPLSITPNYDSAYSALFNFNNLETSDTSTADDVPYTITLNGQDSVTYYHSKRKQDNSQNPPVACNQGPCVELADTTKFPSYNDQPGATNTITITNNSADVNIRLLDGGDQNEWGRIDIYRIYKSKCLDHKITVTQPTSGGYINTPGLNEVLVLDGQNANFDIYAYSGYRIQNVRINNQTDLGAVSNYTFPNVTADKSISATFIRQYHVTLDQAAGGVIAGPATVDAGSDPQYTVTAHCGSIAHVYLDYGTGYQQDLGAHTSPYTFNPFPNISSDHRITAEFSTVPGLYAVGFDADHDTVGDMLTPEPCTFVVDGVSYAPDASGNYGTACLASGKHSFTAVPPYIHDAYQYHPLVHLEYGSNTYTCNPAVIDINSSNVVRALYTWTVDEPSYCTITISAGAHGTIYPNPETHTIQVLQGGCATFRVIPDSGYQVASATFNGQQVTVVNNEFTAESISGNPTFAVTFQQQQQPPTQFSDDFNDNSMNTLYWQQVQAGSASCSESGQQLQVSATGGQNWSQAGYLTANAYNMVDKAATVTVVNQSGVAEMELIVSPTKVTGSDPAGQPNWYRIIRNNSGSVQVQRYLNYNLANLSYSSASTPATLSIAVQNGQIRFYNGGNQIYTESYQLATYDCYIYAVTSSNVTGTGAFDNFSIAPISQQFTITASAGSGGIISPSGQTTVNQGGDQPYTITPNTCYNISNVSVDGVSQGAISSYTFSDVQANHTITATFQLRTYTITSSAGTGGIINPLGTTTVNCGGNQSYTITPNTNYVISNVTVDGVSQGAISSYAFSYVQANHTITATFVQPCQTCYTSCQTSCELSCQDCQTGCEVICQTGCEVSCQSCNTCQTACQLTCQTCNTCQTTCELACQTGCQISCQSCNTCQTACELACQTGCQVACQTGCEVSCQTGCEVTCQSCNTCQTACELACQTGCQVACQTACELACQTGCQVSCQTGCEVACQTGCQVTCQTGCEVSCQSCTACYGVCQTACEACESVCQNCQTGCEVGCQNCQSACEFACQTCNTCQGCQTCVSCEMSEWCPGGYYECQGCETCQEGCEVACQDCQTGCQVACQGCNTCQDCQVCVSCQMLEYCPSGYYECQSGCETCQVTNS